jgi:exodeoxyribonuclease VII small subunit
MVTDEEGGSGGLDKDLDKDEAKSVKPISQLGYEACRDELIEVVRLLEQGGLDLDASLKLWERGEQLAKRCEQHLAGARKRVEDALAAGQGDDA